MPQIHELPLRLSLTEHMRLRINCVATPEQNNGEQCLWHWYPDSGDDGENGVTLHNAVKHCQERHGAPDV